MGGVRHLLLRVIDRKLAPLTWIAPRGLVTALLYLEASQKLRLAPYLDGTMHLVVIASAPILPLSRRFAESGAVREPVP